MTQLELMENNVNISEMRMSRPLHKTVIASILGGFFIALGGIGSVVAQSVLTGGAGKLVGSIMFSLGLILIVLLGAELFTSDCLMSIDVLSGKRKWIQFFKHIFLVYVSNFIGICIGIVVVYFSGLIVISPDVVETTSVAGILQSTAEKKIALDYVTCLTSGILCNILVCAGALFGMLGENVVSKILGIMFPISVFVLCGFEHSIANMFMVPLGLLCKGDLSLFIGYLPSLLVVTVGNVLGGILFISVPLFVLHGKKEVGIK